MIENQNSDNQNIPSRTAEDVETSLLNSLILQHQNESNTPDPTLAEEIVTSDNEESSFQRSIVIEGFEVNNSTIENAGLDPSDFKDKLRKTYAKTDKLLYKKLKKSFEILERRECIKKRMKEDFFDRILLLLLFLAVSPILIMYLIKDISNGYTFAIAVISSMVELFAGIIVLPKIIAQYLFDKDEDKIYFELIKDLRDYHISKKNDIED